MYVLRNGATSDGRMALVLICVVSRCLYCSGKRAEFRFQGHHRRPHAPKQLPLGRGSVPRTTKQQTAAPTRRAAPRRADNRNGIPNDDNRAGVFGSAAEGTETQEVLPDRHRSRRFVFFLLLLLLGRGIHPSMAVPCLHGKKGGRRNGYILVPSTQTTDCFFANVCLRLVEICANTTRRLSVTRRHEERDPYGSICSRTNPSEHNRRGMSTAAYIACLGWNSRWRACLRACLLDSWSYCCRCLGSVFAPV